MARIPPVPYPTFKDATGAIKEQTPPCCTYVPISFSAGIWESLPELCADCTMRGGSTTKPDFWP
ncbi:MAG: hypothetical protein ACO1OF_17585 [Adhaeribacter sp.]